MSEVVPAERRAIHAATHMAYRADIDGLRTLAVLPVVLNHVGIPGFWGGYVGVDIFFVISGYLITGILVRDLAVGRHSLSEFYRRRVLRIFPALFVMLTVVTIIAAVVMLPAELIRYARSLGATTLFGSNILFYSETGYFAPAARLKPLLHTWSLAVEEQFYILWPLMLAAIGTQIARQKALVLAVSVVSLAVAIYLVRVDPASAFYMLPARAWELSIGAMIALGLRPSRFQWLNEALAAMGLLMVLYAIRRYTEATPFPGIAALLPCLGAALMIATGAARTVVARLLALPPVVFVGRISFSLYLWHWPVIVFAEMALFLPRTPLVMAGEVLAGLILAVLSWHFVERPFRVGVSGWRTPVILGVALGVMLLSVVVAAALSLSGGLPARFTPAQRAIAGYAELDGDRLYRGGRCFQVGDTDRYDAARCLVPATGSRPVILIAGDSHAAHLWPGFATHRDRFDVLQATRTGWRPLVYPSAQEGACQRFFRDLLTSWLPAHRVDRLLLAGRWSMGDLPAIEATLTNPAIRRARPILIGPAPQYATALPRLLVFADRRGDPDLPQRALTANVQATDRAMQAVAVRTGTPYVSLVVLLCPQSRCRTWARPGVPMQFDYGHFTGAGSEVVADALLPTIRAR
ncbi:MAG TPA: acyltransferase family protein [Sphingomonas sp.]|jgi:peptidoglycan/LPS O-acetylase OafA/YrhL|uniref:acyltransferase family protein n=1 Tax=Sphingomonas sp. TaxID=28214 RepID=UPI002ED8423F